MISHKTHNDSISRVYTLLWYLQQQQQQKAKKNVKTIWGINMFFYKNKRKKSHTDGIISLRDAFRHLDIWTEWFCHTENIHMLLLAMFKYLSTIFMFSVHKNRKKINNSNKKSSAHARQCHRRMYWCRHGGVRVSFCFFFRVKEWRSIFSPCIAHTTHTICNDVYVKRTGPIVTSSPRFVWWLSNCIWPPSAFISERKTHKTLLRVPSTAVVVSARVCVPSSQLCNRFFFFYLTVHFILRPWLLKTASERRAARCIRVRGLPEMYGHYPWQPPVIWSRKTMTIITRKRKRRRLRRRTAICWCPNCTWTLRTFLMWLKTGWYSLYMKHDVAGCSLLIFDCCHLSSFLANWWTSKTLWRSMDSRCCVHGTSTVIRQLIGSHWTAMSRWCAIWWSAMRLSICVVSARRGHDQFIGLVAKVMQVSCIISVCTVHLWPQTILNRLIWLDTFAAVVQVLLQTGVNVNAADLKGLTPLMTACMYGRTATAAYLLGMNAQNHLTDINGDTALHWAAYKGHPDLMRLLMYSGVDLQKTDNFGSTPLHLACLSGNMTCVRILCEKNNLELEPRDKNGKTPLMLAQSHRHHDVVKLLYNVIKKRSRWMPPLSETWGMLFGGAGNSKGPLLLFVISVLLWGYPMYMIRVWQATAPLETKHLESNSKLFIVFHYTGHSNDMEHFAQIALLLHLLEHCHVGQLDNSESSRSRLHTASLRSILSRHQADTVLWKVEKTQSQPDPFVSQLPLFASAARQTLSHLQSMRVIFRPSLPVHLQLCRPTESHVVLHVCAQRGHQLFIHHLLCLILRHDRGVYTALHAWTAGGHRLLWPRMDSHVYIGKYRRFTLIAHSSSLR